MPTRADIEKRRIQAAEDAAKQTAGVVRVLQNAMYSKIADWIVGNIETDGGKIVYSTRNFGRLRGFRKAFAAFQAEYQDTLIGTILKYAGRLFGLNADYFDTFETPAESVSDAARRLTLLRWGYNTETGKIIPGGYLESIFNSETVAQAVARLMNRAIAAKMALKDFQKAFRSVFVGSPGQGMLERHWRTNSFDLYQRIDRTANLIYADRLGLNYAIYSGTLEEDSRPFCIARVNKVYDRKQIAAWADLEFAGKPKVGYDPFTDCGGFNCRHHLSFVSDQIAQALKDRQGV